MLAVKSLLPRDHSASGVVVIETDPSGATIRVDKMKTPFGTTPWSGWLEGKHTAVLEKPGYLPMEVPLSIAPGKLSVVSAPLLAETPSP